MSKILCPLCFNELEKRVVENVKYNETLFYCENCTNIDWVKMEYNECLDELRQFNERLNELWCK